MELTYRLTREELWNYVRLCVARVAEHASGWRSRPFLVGIAVGLLGLAPLVYLLFGQIISGLGYWVAILAYAWGALSVCLCGWSRQRLLRRNFWPDDSPSLSEIRLQLDGHGIEASGQTMANKYSWQSISEVSEAGDLVVLWFDRAQGIVVPRRAFVDEEARQAFINTARGHLQPAAA